MSMSSQYTLETCNLFHCESKLKALIRYAEVQKQWQNYENPEMVATIPPNPVNILVNTTSYAMLLESSFNP